jgi:aspartate/methionine/tyrosine aminotransferase
LDPSTTLIYGSVLGQPKLRQRILSLYDDAPHELFMSITQGAISANFLVLDTIIGPEDHVICQYPTYQQLYEVPRRAGAEISLWKTKEENSWNPDLEELPNLVRSNTKMMIIKYANRCSSKRKGIE